MLRIGLDVDGVLADFDTAFQAVSDTVLASSGARPRGPREMNRIWRQIQRTPNWWETLAPCEADALPRLRAATDRHDWTVFFLTNRPPTSGRTVQEQTRRWLERQGYPGAAVVPLSGMRAQIVRPLELDAIVDDRADNCVDAARETGGRVWLLSRTADDEMVHRLGKQGVLVARTIPECISAFETLEKRLGGSRLSRLRRWLAGRFGS